MSNCGIIVQAMQMQKTMDAKGTKHFREEIRNYIKVARKYGCSDSCIAAIVKKLKGEEGITHE